VCNPDLKQADSFFCPGHLEIVKLLVGRGADVMCKDTQGYTPLHAAAGGGQLDVVKYLLTLNVEVK